jgi:hypothetical protein
LRKSPIFFSIPVMRVAMLLRVATGALAVTHARSTALISVEVFTVSLACVRA